jgi:gliding motility-associated-like protein
MQKITTLLIFILLSAACYSQVLSGHRTYRVTAFKKGNNNVYSVSNYAEVASVPSVFVPSAFTPNSDGINDIFRIKGENLQNFTLKVFNRWGEVIFESSNPNDGWDGKFQGNPVQNDTYVYQVTAKNLVGRNLTGAVTLIR